MIKLLAQEQNIIFLILRVTMHFQLPLKKLKLLSENGFLAQNLQQFAPAGYFTCFACYSYVCVLYLYRYQSNFQ